MTQATWYQARSICSKRGGNLATILDKRENDIAKSKGISIWIGMNKARCVLPSNDGQFFYTNCENNAPHSECIITCKSKHSTSIKLTCINGSWDDVNKLHCPNSYCDPPLETNEAIPLNNDSLKEKYDLMESVEYKCKDNYQFYNDTLSSRICKLDINGNSYWSNVTCEEINKTGKSTSIAWWGWLLIAIAIFALLFGIIVAVFMMKRRKSRIIPKIRDLGLSLEESVSIVMDDPNIYIND